MEIHFLQQKCLILREHCLNKEVYSVLDIPISVLVYLKVSKSQKQNIKFSHTPKNQRNFVHFFSQASKKWLKQKIKALDDLD